MVLSSTCFKFNDKFYEQVYGSPMGSPLSPVLADLVMEDLEAHCIGLLDFNLRIFVRYVDDVFTVLSVDKIQTVLRVFNDYHPRLQFTFELEKDNHINFLDTTVIRDGNALITNWARKATFSGRYINYHSNHPDNHKISVITNLVDRAILLSDPRFHVSNIEIVRKILTNNCYPLTFINKHISKGIRRIKGSDNTEGKHDQHANNNLVILPYIKQYSGIIKTKLNRLGIKVLYKTVTYHLLPLEKDQIMVEIVDHIFVLPVWSK
ncbi:hypothetical protein DMN91_001939 [Ooceraea biroi]|uniref:Reverse transcriptase domain-containing protein n=1 Tax=Ooceraea biroi TaxID=2015173 RepID=A0A3L8DZ83_OOCBI|nr:hypothetical protein DMN91_001939 [Ooceraea biroi]